jgi:hypothetical protein
MEKEKDIEVHSSDVSVYVLDTGLYRIDVRPNAETEVFVFSGLVEAAGETGSVLIKDEQRVEATAGHFTSRPTAFFAVADDSFDRWSEDRDAQIRKHLAKRYLPEELEDYEYELREYGEWIYVFPYGLVWVPMDIDPYWRPYHYGRWMWVPICGWTWIPYEPWGWATHHYGWWHWHAAYGWYWIPGSVWSPGWVSWYWGPDYIGWAPRSYWGYPGVVINNLYYDRYSGQYYPQASRALTVIHKNQLKARNVSKIALSQNSIQKLGKFNLSNQTPTLRPAGSTVDIQKLDGKRVFLKKKDSPVTFKEGKAISQPTAKKSVILDSVQRKKPEARNTKRPIESAVKKFKSYPSSPSISLKNYKITKTSKKPNSAISRIYKRITKNSSSISKIISRGSSRSLSSGKISSRTGAKSSRSVSSRSSSSKSSSKSSRKIKKKK